MDDSRQITIRQLPSPWRWARRLESPSKRSCGCGLSATRVSVSGVETRDATQFRLWIPAPPAERDWPPPLLPLHSHHHGCTASSSPLSRPLVIHVVLETSVVARELLRPETVRITAKASFIPSSTTRRLGCACLSCRQRRSLTPKPVYLPQSSPTVSRWLDSSSRNPSREHRAASVSLFVSIIARAAAPEFAGRGGTRTAQLLHEAGKSN